MPRLRVIVLDQPLDNPNTYNVALWADVPSSRQSFYANASTKSAWSGAQAADNTALQSGAMVEQVQVHAFTGTPSLAQVEAYLQTQWQNYQNNIANYNPWSHYGSTWDGTTWTITSVI